MPLHDHFHSPFDRKVSWEGFHALWPSMMILQLIQKLPARYTAEPRVHVGSAIEVDIGALDQQELGLQPEENSNGLGYGFSEPNVAVETELLTTSEYEVRVFDMKRNRRIVAAIEIISPSNKDRPESRQVFVAKCESLLKNGVSVAIVDLVTSKNFNLYTDLLELVGEQDPTLGQEPPGIYAAACRWIPRGRKHVLETWSHVMHLGRPLPTLPIWLAENYHVPLDLEACYEETCRVLRIA